MTIPSTSAHFQPARPIIKQLVAALQSDTWDQLDMPVAYAVLGGVRLLEEELSADPRWAKIRKRFLVGIDWFRSEPVPLDALVKLPNASLRVVDGKRVIDLPGCRPVRSYHPKAFIFARGGPSESGAVGCLIGSANLSRNGLSYGHELDLWSCSAGATDEVVAALGDICHWFGKLWARSTPYQDLRDAYRAKFEKHQRTAARATTDDDTVPDVIVRQRGLKPDDLVVLRSFDNLWIDTGSMYSNLGKGRSGNQLDLRRYTRVFFGFPARNLSRNSPIGSIVIVFDRTIHPNRHLRYGDNQMDKLDLPVSADSSVDYRNQTVLFTREIGPRGRVRFLMQLGDAGERARWRAKSRRLSALFKFAGSSDREFGVF